MSADNWAKCPRCCREGEEALAAQQARVDEAYGVVSVEEFDRMRGELAQARLVFDGENTNRTFREDYTICGAEDGVVTVWYKGHCAKCRLSLEFSEDHPILGV